MNNSTTFQNDNDLVVPLEANAFYAVDAFLMWTSGTVPDFKMQFIGPLNVVMFLTFSTWSMAAAAPNQLADTRAVYVQGFVSLPGQGSNPQTQGQWTRITGHVNTLGSAGNFQLQWAQLNLNASDTVVYAGSWLRVDRTG